MLEADRDENKSRLEEMQKEHENLQAQVQSLQLESSKPDTGKPKPKTDTGEPKPKTDTEKPKSKQKSDTEGSRSTSASTDPQPSYRTSDVNLSTDPRLSYHTSDVNLSTDPQPSYCTSDVNLSTDPRPSYRTSVVNLSTDPRPSYRNSDVNLSTDPGPSYRTSDVNLSTDPRPSYRTNDVNLSQTLINISPVNTCVSLSKMCYRLCYNQDNWYLPCSWDDCINVYSKDFQLLHTISNDDVKYPRSLHPLNDSHMILAAKTGLYIISNDSGVINSQVLPGDFHDVHVNNKTCAAVESVSDSNDIVHILTTADLPTVTFKFKISKNFGLWCTILVLINNDILIGSHHHDNVTRYSMTGEILSVYGRLGKGKPGLLHRPRLCITDHQDSILIADFFNSRIQMLSSAGDWYVILTLERDKYPWDVVIVGQNMYVLYLNDNDQNAKFEIQKYNH